MEQKSPITGYRNLTEQEVGDMNAGKALAVEVGTLIDRLMDNPDYDKRWIAIGKTQLQQGFMAVLRGVARPTTF